MTIKAGITMKNKFLSPKDKRYKHAIDYLDKDCSKRCNNLDKFVAFEQEVKQAKRLTAVFTEESDALTKKQKKELKEAFIEARENESPMWQTVFSFDQDYLREIGLYRIGENGFIDEGAFRQATRLAMHQLITDMGLGETAEWGASIHFDTDNVHVHAMLVSKQPDSVVEKINRHGKDVFRAKIPPSVQRRMKRTFGNSIAHRDPTLARISTLMRTELIQQTRKKGYGDDLHLLRGVSQLMDSLPTDRRLWKYGNQAMIPHRKTLDQLSHELMVRNNPEGLKELDRLLTEESAFFVKTYGEEANRNNNGKTYKDNKYEKLYQRMGNVVLKELSSMVSCQEGRKNRTCSNETNKRMPTKKGIRHIQTVLDHTHQDFLNKFAYQREEARKEWTNHQLLQQEERGRSL